MRLLLPSCIFPTGRFEDSFLSFAVLFDFGFDFESNRIESLHSVQSSHLFFPTFSLRLLFPSLWRGGWNWNGLIVGLAYGLLV